MTINSELTLVQTSAQSLKDKIVEKGQTVATTDTWISLVSKIDAISGSGAASTQNNLAEVLAGTVVNLYDDTLNYIRPYCFRYCTQLERAQFTSITKICQYAFQACYRLNTLILSGSFVKLDNVNAFKYTQIGTNGYVYVTDSLLSTYRAADGWKELGEYVRSVAMLDTTSSNYLSS